MQSVKIRVGVEGARKAVLDRAAALGAPILVSANSLWNNRRNSFAGWEGYSGHDVALDSGGFVAMNLYGGFRWTVAQYASLAKAMAPTWWAQMDFCCEPEIVSGHAAIVDRIKNTARHLEACKEEAGAVGATQPMPVLQGWNPEDYCNGPIYDRDYEWPNLVGIGSVCRRQIHGKDGVLAVVEALNEKVPAHVKFHLFGVKSQAIELLLAHFPNRIASMDSMAWDRRCRWDCFESKTPRTNDVRAASMADWYTAQVKRVDKPTQLRLF